MPDRPLTEVHKAGQLYLDARFDCEHCRRQHEANPNDPELLLALEAADGRQRQAWVKWLNLAKASLSKG